MRFLMLASACAFAMTTAAAQADGQKQPDDHAPIGVMGDHLHKQGEWMISYKYELSRSTGLRSGAHTVSNNSVLGVYGEAATKMTMDMHMFEIMYGVSDDLTLMVMPQYMQMSMLHQSNHGGGHAHVHETQGPGDTEVTGLYSIYRGKNTRAHLNFGVSLPTGSITETFTDHHNTIYNMPYNMQFGSGTFDPILGATYTGDAANWSWGAQTINYLRFGKNSEGYRQGNKFTGTVWLARNLNDIASLSFRLDGEDWGNVHGRDASLPLNIIAGANPNEIAGRRVMANVGLNLLGGKTHGPLAGHRLAAEVGLPLYEHYSGPQPETDYRLTLGWQYSF